jgi:hypothetical protein
MAEESYLKDLLLHELTLFRFSYTERSCSGSKPRRIPRNNKPEYYCLLSNNNETNYQAGDARIEELEPQPSFDSDGAFPVPIELLTEKCACPDHIEK